MKSLATLQLPRPLAEYSVFRRSYLQDARAHVHRHSRGDGHQDSDRCSGRHKPNQDLSGPPESARTRQNLSELARSYHSRPEPSSVRRSAVEIVRAHQNPSELARVRYSISESIRSRQSPLKLSKTYQSPSDPARARQDRQRQLESARAHQNLLIYTRTH
jgi:hypothetical protein